MKEEKRRRYDRGLKLVVVSRMLSGESAAALSAELGIGLGQLYRWRKAVRCGSDDGLRDPGRPRRVQAPPGLEPGLVSVGEPRAGDLEGARRQIEALQRKIGEQQVALDFFKGALRRIEASRQPNDGLGGTTSSPRSRR